MHLSDRQPEPLPIWMAALCATECKSVSRGGVHPIAWGFHSGHAVYTNLGMETEMIQPFGLPVRAGETLTVSWQPGETAFTLELLPLAA